MKLYAFILITFSVALIGSGLGAYIGTDLYNDNIAKKEKIKYNNKNYRVKVYKVKIHSNGAQFWYNKNKMLHREDGPAYIWADGTEVYYLNGKLHREDGPAIIWADGTEGYYYLNGESLSKEEFENRTKELK